MQRSRSLGLSACALLALTAVGLAALSAGLHRAGDSIILPAATPTTVFASAHPVDPSEHLDPLTTWKTVLCIACLQQLERRTHLLGPAVFTKTVVAGAAFGRERVPSVRTTPPQTFSPRGPPRA